MHTLLGKTTDAMMGMEVGLADFPLWLIGDSNPKRWEKRLTGPLDPRHPARHNIWTSVLDVMQDRIYRASRMRIDTSRVYVRNALADAASKPGPSETQWGTSVLQAVADLRRLIHAHWPMAIFCFGSFAFEFVRRAVGEKEPHSTDFWSAQRLGDEFRERIRNFEPGNLNPVPLLHVSIARGKFIEAHEYFCGRAGANYFDVVGSTLANTMLQYRNQLPIWIE